MQALTGGVVEARLIAFAGEHIVGALLGDLSGDRRSVPIAAIEIEPVEEVRSPDHGRGPSDFPATARCAG